MLTTLTQAQALAAHRSGCERLNLRLARKDTMPQRKNILDHVRQLMPMQTLSVMPRPLMWAEARIIAERQAAHLLRLLRIKKPSVEIERVLTSAPIQIEAVPNLDNSAYSGWKDDHWHVLMNADESIWRSRASLAHEVKHILDDPFREILYPNWPRDSLLPAPDEAEQICDYFAGCVLVPERLLLAAWRSGTCDVPALAQLFEVSPSLITVRLRQTGILPPRHRESWMQYTRRAYQRGSALAVHAAHVLTFSRLRHRTPAPRKPEVSENGSQVSVSGGLSV